MKLKNNSKIHIIGGGPSGAFVAIHLLNEAAKAGKKFEVTIIDQSIIFDHNCRAWRFKGCNYCAGVISPGLDAALVKHGIAPPEDVVCEKFSHIWIQGQWKNFPFKVPSGTRLVSVFRGSLPKKRDSFLMGFDAFLLNRARQKGAMITAGRVREIRYDNDLKPVLTIESFSGEIFEIPSDFVCIATGINAGFQGSGRAGSLLSSYRRINPAFVPPAARRTLVFEMKPGRDYLKRHMHKELYIIVSGSKTLQLEHIALIPKKDYLTCALVGKSIDRAALPQDTPKIIRSFLSLPQVRSILPHITVENAPIVCQCTPNMSVSVCESPFADRIALAGDALGSRLYRDGLYSAFINARHLSKTAVRKGVDKTSLRQGNMGTIEWLRKDNRYCKLVFGAIQVILKSKMLSRIFYQTFASEMKFKKKEAWHMGHVLWEIGSGSADYKTILKRLFSFPVFLSFLKGIFKTSRNFFTEIFFGISWGEYGRYPAVILKEKRQVIKKSIQAPPGIKLDPVPEMERMYAVKIRASAGAIFRELGKFGDANATFLRLRFVDVKRVKGEPNTIGTIVRYRLKAFPVAMDIRLIRSVPDKSLLYEPCELFTKKGVLLFDIRPTRDGNNRLVVYTAFDYRRGKTLLSKAFFALFRFLFPDYAHDVVWNHAICSIKAEAEKSEPLIY